MLGWNSPAYVRLELSRIMLGWNSPAFHFELRLPSPESPIAYQYMDHTVFCFQLLAIHLLQLQPLPSVSHYSTLSVYHVVLWWSDITRIENFVGFNSLQKLQLDNNRLRTIENISHLTTLTWLGMQIPMLGARFLNCL